MPWWVETDAPCAESLAESSSAAPELDEYPAATCTPDRARTVLIAAPIPRAPPVTMATRGSGAGGVSVISCSLGGVRKGSVTGYSPNATRTSSLVVGVVEGRAVSAPARDAGRDPGAVAVRSGATIAGSMRSTA